MKTRRLWLTIAILILWVCFTPFPVLAQTELLSNSGEQKSVITEWLADSALIIEQDTQPVTLLRLSFPINNAVDVETSSMSLQESTVTNYIRQKFPLPEIVEAFKHADAVKLEKTPAGIKLKTGYLRSSKPQAVLKPEEMKALEAMAARDNLKKVGLPVFMFGKDLSTGYAIKYNGSVLKVRHVMKSGKSSGAVIESGAVVYPDAHKDTSILYVMSPGRCQEMLLLKSEKAPKQFEYEYSEEVSLNENGEIIVGGLTLSRPVIFDAAGRRVNGFYRKITERKVLLAFNGVGLRYPLLIDPIWQASVGSMSVVREHHTATLLSNGKVLVVGGSNLSSAELYDPTSGTFSATGSMTSIRDYHTATLLPNGKVLVTGGGIGSTSFSSAELYDPTSGTFSATGSMNVPRQGHTATLLSSGKVLIAGGEYVGTPVSSAELYDPTSGIFSITGLMGTGRWWHTATLLSSGKVLITGGRPADLMTSFSSAELYDPTSGTFSATGSMGTGRWYHTATLLSNGKVLITGGAANNFIIQYSAELYDPNSGTFSGTDSMSVWRYEHAAISLDNGKVLIIGGYGETSNSSAELYDPNSETFSPTSSMSETRSRHAATLLSNGKVLVAGGYGRSSAELYDVSFASGTFLPTGSMGATRRLYAATPLLNGKILMAGGSGRSSAELYNPNAETFSTTGSMSTVRSVYTATLLPNGKVLVAGGWNGSISLSSAELYDPNSGTFSATGSMTSMRDYHTATLLPNGKVLVVGGEIGSTPVSSAELYDPNSGTFSATGSMSVARRFHTATLLSNGKVLITGGDAGSNDLSSAELYDPDLGTFSAISSMNEARRYHTATLLSNGKVLIAGGVGHFSAELYDQNSGAFFATGSMSTKRYYHTATVLANGKVLVVGGSWFFLVDLYDPVSGTFSTPGSISAARFMHAATLLPNGKVLVAGGYNNSPYLSSAELYTYLPLPIPILSSPANKHLYPSTITSGTLSWNSSYSATSYDVQIGSSCGSTNLTSLNTSNLSAAVSGLTIGQTYYWRVQARNVSDVSGYLGCYSFSLNTSPNTPSTPTGSTSLTIGQSGAYSTSATDMDGNQVKYGWDWNGDGIVDEWSGFGNSGWTDIRSHTWGNSGIYNTQVKTQDSNGDESDWSPILLVTVCGLDISDSSTNAYPLDTTHTVPDQCISSSADIDWYKVSASAGVTIQFDLSVPSGRDYAIELYGRDNSNLNFHWLKTANAGGVGQAEILTYDTTIDGEYFVRVYGIQGAFNTSQFYSITYTPPVTAGLPDLTISASPASSYVSGQGGVTIPVTVNRAGGDLTALYVHTALYWSTNGVWDSGNQPIWLSNDSASPDFPVATLNASGSKSVAASISIPSVPSGTYYLIAYADSPQPSYPSGYHTESNETNNIAVYPVSITASASCTDSFEVNGTPAQAYGPIASGVSISAKICDGNDQDYYKLDLAGAARIELSLSSVTAQLDLDLELLSSLSQRVMLSDKGAGIKELITYDAPSAGTYYIHVFGYSGSNDPVNPYILSGRWSTTAANQPPQFTALPRQRWHPNLSSDLTEGEEVYRSGIYFTAMITDPENDAVSFEVRLTKPNLSQIILTGDPALSGSEITVSTDGLTNGDYTWEYRAVDGNHPTPAWMPFGEPDKVDFTLINSLTTPALCGNQYFGDQGLFLCSAAADTETLAGRIPLIFVHGICFGDECQKKKAYTCLTEPIGDDVADYQCVWKEFLEKWMSSENEKVRAIYKPYVFRYETGAGQLSDGVRDVPDVAAKLREKIIANLPITTSSAVIVAHSLGGLVSRSFMQEETCGAQKCGAYVKRLITLASPHEGAESLGEGIDLFVIGSGKLGSSIQFAQNAMPQNLWLQCLNSYSPNYNGILIPACVDLGDGFYSKIIPYRASKLLADPIVPAQSAAFLSRANRNGLYLSAGSRDLLYCEGSGFAHSALPRGRCWANIHNYPENSVFDYLRKDLEDVSPSTLGQDSPPQKPSLFVMNGNLSGGSGTSSTSQYRAQATPSASPTASVIWIWADLSNETSYMVVNGAGIPVSPVLSADTTSWIETGLSVNTQYTRMVRASNAFGASESLPVTKATVVAAPESLSAANLSASKVRVGWTDTINPSDTGYRIEVSTLADFGIVTHVSDVQDIRSADIHGLLPATTYYFQINSVNRDGIVATSISRATTTTVQLPVTWQVASVSGPGRWTATDTHTILTLDELPVTDSVMLISTQPLNEPIEVNPGDILNANAALPSRFITGSPTREFVLYSGTSPITTGIVGSITLLYEDAEEDLLVDGSIPTLHVTDLRPYRLNDIKWEQVPGPIAINTKQRTVTFSIDHLSVYTLNGPMVSVVRPMLSSARVYPMPWEPNSAGRFGSATVTGCGTGLIFDNLTNNGNIRIYTIPGDLVRVISFTAADNGCIAWDGKNAAGRNVASGVYIAIVTSPGAGGGTLIKKLAIER